jgi:hypothetical protein
MLRSLVVGSVLLATLSAFADSPKKQRIEVPRAPQKPPYVNGSVTSAEWARAARVFLGDGGHALLLHDRTFLYIALVGTQPGVASVCTSSAPGRVSVLHASGSLGAARFEKSGAKWTLTRPFTMVKSAATSDVEAEADRKKFLQAEAWYASTNPTFVKQREYQLRIGGRTEIPLVLAFISAVKSDEYDLDAWPSTVYDGCVELGLAGGSSEGTFTFEPESWGVAVLVP